MAANLKSRAGAAKLGVPLMILCFLTVGGFLYWLSRSAEPTEVAEVVEETGAALANVVALSEFSTGTAAYVGQEVTLEGIEVVSLLGTQALWMNLENGTPYLLHLTEMALADSVAVAQGDVVTVSGAVMEMSDSILDAWAAAGAFSQETDRIQAEFAVDFLEVTLVIADAAEEGDEEAASEPSS